MRELPYYRDVMQDLTEHIGSGAWIPIMKLAEYDHCDPRTARKRYGIPDDAKGINKCVLAHKICELAK